MPFGPAQDSPGATVWPGGARIGRKNPWFSPLRPPPGIGPSLEEIMSNERLDGPAIDRRRFLKASLIPATLPIVNVRADAAARSDEPAPGPDSRGPEIIDSNVHLFEWAFRELKYDRTAALVAKLRRHRITQAWAGSFEAILHKQLDASNRRLAEECR